MGIINTKYINGKAMIFLILGIALMLAFIFLGKTALPAIVQLLFVVAIVACSLMFLATVMKTRYYSDHQ